MNDLDKSRNQLVVKDNDLIRKARFNLTLNQQKLIAYVISLIKPTDKELMMYELSVADFCELCGIDKTYFYTEFKEILLELDKKSFFVETDEKAFNFRWFSEFEYLKGKGKIRLQLNSNIKRYLIELSESFTQYELYNILALKGKYSIRLYEWFKSYSFMRRKDIDLDSLKKVLEAENYVNFKDFRTRVLTKAIEEINEFTDLVVSYELLKEGRKVVGIEFYISKKEPLERYGSYRKTIDTLNKKNKQINGQMSIWDRSEEEFSNEQ